MRAEIGPPFLTNYLSAIYKDFLRTSVKTGGTRSRNLKLFTGSKFYFEMLDRIVT